ncbi:MAG TPA: hypothetical protein QGF63_18060 [Alphaproteobacteria bacterium]|jgi:chemotaxis protein CheZ|nr:hypothetical protein [Alphaproteobacteria bacterium]HJM51734.1 hypothetical protein [Alphaproteobacteria bacterium]|tara:strand:- start:671 stop:829 length:159 start_codon:yes stop_codon:yes gene_type:complete
MALATAMDGETSLKLQQITTKIYEVPNFQDITGQRTTKVVKAAGHDIDAPFD